MQSRWIVASMDSAVAVQMEGSGPCVVVLAEEFALVHEVADMGERAASAGHLSEEGDPARALVEPRGLGGGGVDVDRGRLASQVLPLGGLWGVSWRR